MEPLKAVRKILGLVLSPGVVLLLLLQCSQNPFFDDDWIQLGNRRIHGRVSLSDGKRPDDVIVWLEGFDLGTRTDQEGSFELTLPPPSAQPGGGLWGGFYLYFYSANYRLTLAEIIVQKGYVLDNNGAIGEGGQVISLPALQKILDISTEVDPDTIESSFEGEIECTVTLRAVEDTVLVITRMFEDTLRAFFIQNTTALDAWSVENGLHLESLQEIGDLPTAWKGIIPPLSFPQEPGNYEMVPFILISQPFIPPGLLQYIGPLCQQFSPDFLNIPVKREGGELVVSEGDVMPGNR